MKNKRTPIQNKRTPILVAAASLLGFAMPSQAAVIAEEYFNGYGDTNIALDDLTNGGTGWATSWNQTTNTRNGYVAGSSLSYTATGYDNSSNLSGGSDGAVGGAFNTDQYTIGRAFATPAAGTVWVSALASITNIGAGGAVYLYIDSVQGTLGNDFIGFNGTTNQTNMRYNGTDYNSLTAPAINTTHLLLAKAEVDYSGTFDRLSFWLNPDLSSGESSLGAATYSDDGADTFGTTIDGIGLMVIASDGRLDAIRVGTTLADVTAIPEPGAALLGSLGLLALLRRRR